MVVNNAFPCRVCLLKLTVREKLEKISNKDEFWLPLRCYMDLLNQSKIVQNYIFMAAFVNFDLILKYRKCIQ